MVKKKTGVGGTSGGVGENPATEGRNDATAQISKETLTTTAPPRVGPKKKTEKRPGMAMQQDSPSRPGGARGRRLKKWIQKVATARENKEKRKKPQFNQRW